METTSSKSKSSWCSSKSSRSRKGSGFTSYFRNQRKREAELKEEGREIAEEKLRELLQPVRFSEEEEERIQKLKDLKRWNRGHRQQQERRRGFKAMVMPPIPETGVADTLKELDTEVLGRLQLPLDENQEDSTVQDKLFQRNMKALHQHTWEERAAVVTTLMVLLFVSLHADIVGPIFLPTRLFLDNSLVPWYIIVLKDWGTFCHMSACALIHFALCDVSLIYAFEAMEVGTKTGPKVKEFYREKVHFVIAALSGSIVALSICKALVAAWLRMLCELLETAIALVGHGKDACAYLVHQIGHASHTMVAGLSRIGHAILRPSEWISSVLKGLARFLTAVCIWILAVLIPFDAEERPLAARMVGLSQSDSEELDSSQCEDLATMFNNALNATSNETIGDFVNSHSSHTAQPLNVIYWRNDAFETCRFLLSHSAVFLVSLLVAMHYYTKGYRHKPNMSRIGAGGPSNATGFPDDHSSIQTTPSLARDETELHANMSSDTSIETYSTVAATRPTAITITIHPCDETRIG
jgi:hypothetical protein